MSMEKHLSMMGFAQTGPDIWFRGFTHPESGSRLMITVKLEYDGKVLAIYRRDGRLHKKRTYTRSPAVAANAIRMSVKRAGYEI